MTIAPKRRWLFLVVSMTAAIVAAFLIGYKAASYDRWGKTVTFKRRSR